MAQKARIEVYDDGSVIVSNLRNNLGVPIIGLDNNLTATRVTQWWDGTNMDESKVDNQLYIQLKALPSGSDSELEQYIGDYFKVNLPNDGELFLEKNTMAEMRGLSPVEILLLRSGYYRGVKLNGYYTKGDTPGPIEYLLSTTSDADDGGSVVEAGGIKLEHIFRDDYNLKYFGVRGLYSFDGFDPQTDKEFNATEGKLIQAPNGNVLFFYRKTAKGLHNHNDGNIFYKVSSDEGVTWGEEVQVTNSDYDTRNFVVGTTGANISVIWREYNVGGSPASLGCRSIYSSDSGVTWSAPVVVDPNGTASVVPFGKILDRGTYFAFIMYGQGVPNSQCHMYTSADGVTWTANTTALYNLTGYTVAEPVIEDLPDGSSIIIGRNGAGGNGENFYQFIAPDGLTFGTPTPTNLYSDTEYARLPAWIEYIGNDEVLVLVNSRMDAVSEDNLNLGMRAYIGNINSIKTNPQSYLLTHQIPRIFRSTSVTYGYPSLLKVSYGFIGCLTERRYVDEALKTLSSLYENEADDIQIFRLVKEAKGSYNVFGNSQIKNINTGNPDYIITDNDVFSDEENFSNHIWKSSVQDPTDSGVLSFEGRMALLQSFNNASNNNYPQGVQGGLVILAQASSGVDGVKWLIGRGNSNADQGYLFVNTYASNLQQWSGWKRLALSEDITTITDNLIPDQPVTDLSWDDIPKGKIGFYYNLDGAPTGTGYFGFNIASSTSGNTSMKMMFRNNRAFMRFTESGVEQGDLELITSANEATTAAKGIVNQSAAIADVTTPDATDEATAVALANANKAKINEMLTKLRTAGIIVE